MKNINRKHPTKAELEKSQKSKQHKSLIESEIAELTKSQDFMKELADAYASYEKDGSFTLQEFREKRGI